jgi:MobA/VirD2-like, nuclease domain
VILKGSQRGGARQLAAHLSNAEQNDHVEVTDIRGLAAGDLAGALLEMEALARATRSTQPLFCVSFNPPGAHELSLEQFERAFAAVEQKFGLADQPRAIVFHEKEGRRHAHVAWSRVDAATMRAIPMSHFKLKLCDVARELCNEFEIDTPKGLLDKRLTDPTNFDQRTWQQAARIGEDPRDLKKIVQAAYANAGSALAFAAELEHHALILARGDRRDFVILHHSSELLSVPRYLGIRTKDVRSKLGDPAKLPSLTLAKEKMQKIMAADYERRIFLMKRRHAADQEAARGRVLEMRGSQRKERAELKESLQKREASEAFGRADRLRALHPRPWDRLRVPREPKASDRPVAAGFKTLGRWFANLADRITGREKVIADLNVADVKRCGVRDRLAREELIRRQGNERRSLQTQIVKMRASHAEERLTIRRQMASWLAGDQPSYLRSSFLSKSLGQGASGGKQARGREPPQRERGPEPSR